MANVIFKRGLYENLASATIIDGAFYLTEDTGKLYAGIGSQLVNLSKSVDVVDTIDNLPATPEKDDFVYVTDGNMLLVCTNKDAEGLSKWTQVNPDTDTNDNTKVTDASAFEVVPEEGKITVTLNIAQTTTNVDGEETEEEIIPLSFEITQDQFSSVVEDTAVDVTAAAGDDGSITIKTDGIGSAGNGFTLVGNKIKLEDVSTDEGTVIEIVGTKYSFGIGNNEAIEEGSYLSLYNDYNNAAESIDFRAGQDLEVNAIGIHEAIVYSHTTIETTPDTTEAETPAAGESFQVLDSIEVANGHVTGYKTKEITLPPGAVYSIPAVDAEDGAGIVADAQGQITIKLVDQNGNNVGAVSGQDLFYTVNGEKVYNQGTIEFYTKGEIDNKLSGVNAMVYRGTLGETGTITELIAEGDGILSIGDTYMVATAGTYGDVIADVGDLFIATGTEVDGVIFGPVDWTYVPSGDDTDTQYKLDVANNIITLSNSVDPTTSDKIKIEGDTGATDSEVTILVNTVVDPETSEKSIAVTHKKYIEVSDAVATPEATEVQLAGGDSIEILAPATILNGHVATVSNTKYILPEINEYSQTQEIVDATSTDDKTGISITNTLTNETTQTTESTMISVVSETLAISKVDSATDEAGRYSIEVEWGTF